MNSDRSRAAPNGMSPLLRALRARTDIFRIAAGFSLLIIVTSLAPTVFMLQVYDRVINSRSTATLLALLGVVIGVYVLMEILETVRSRLLYQAGWIVDSDIREQLHDASFISSLRHDVASTQAFTDLKTLRELIPSPAITAVLDLPSSLLFLILVALINPWLAVVALIGAVVQVGLGVITEKKTMPLLTEANQAAISAMNFAGGVMRNSQIISALGMKQRIHERWIARQRRFLKLQAQASDTAGMNSAVSKFIQTLQGSLILGLSCWFEIKGMLAGGGGMMVIASVLGGRMLSPMVQLVGQWRLVVNGRDAYRRLDRFLTLLPPSRQPMPLPVPEGRLSVEAVVATAPGSSVPIIRNVSFSLSPGESLMIIGPSAAGKTALARVLTGVWPANSGKVRIDGSDIELWDKARLGPHLGYLPQSVELFDGTLAENIARFGAINQDTLIEATNMVGLSELIDSLPEGLNTRIGEDGAMLSGGQRQRIGLARAIYGSPSIIVLDEPNASLDEAGEQALLQTLMALKAKRCTTIVIAHRKSLLQAADKLLFLRDGAIAALGPRDEVLAALQKNAANAQPARLPAITGESRA